MYGKCNIFMSDSMPFGMFLLEVLVTRHINMIPGHDLNIDKMAFLLAIYRKTLCSGLSQYSPPNPWTSVKGATKCCKSRSERI